MRPLQSERSIEGKGTIDEKTRKWKIWSEGGTKSISGLNASARNIEAKPHSNKRDIEAVMQSKSQTYRSTFLVNTASESITDVQAFIAIAPGELDAYLNAGEAAARAREEGGTSDEKTRKWDILMAAQVEAQWCTGGGGSRSICGFGSADATNIPIAPRPAPAAAAAPPARPKP